MLSISRPKRAERVRRGGERERAEGRGTPLTVLMTLTLIMHVYFDLKFAPNALALDYK